MKRLPTPHQTQAYVLRLYVNDSTPKSRLAILNITRVCEQRLQGRHDLKVIDICQHANLAREAQIVAVPTLIRHLPGPLHRLVGDMSNINQVLLGLGLRMGES